MNLSEPSWRVKTLPCPFYHKKGCFFSDSCNFIHDISVISSPEPIPDKFGSSEQEEKSGTPPVPPKVIIDSPSSHRFPARSPRTASLLLALRDVIGDVDDLGAGSWSESLPTLVNDNGFAHPDTAGEEEEEDPDFEASWTAMSDYSDDDTVSALILPESEQDTLMQSHISSGHDDIPSLEGASPSSENRSSVITERTSGLLSPIEIPTLDLGPFRRNLARSLSIDTSGSVTQNWKPPNPLQRSPPRSPSIASTFELLSSPFGSHSTRILSPRLSVFMPCSPLSPSRTGTSAPPEEIEPLDLSLDSPQDRTEPRMSTSFKDVAESWNNRVPDGIKDDGDDFSETDDDFVLQPSVLPWDADSDSQTAFYTAFDPQRVREQVNDAIDRASRTPTHFLSKQELSFSETEPAHSSSLLDDDDTQGSLDEDACIRVSRLLHAAEDMSDHGDTSNTATVGSPNPRLNQNNSFNSFYDIYSGIVSPRDVSENSIPNLHLSPRALPLSSASTPASSLRERVFTPPLQLPMSSAGSLDSVQESPLTSVDPASRRASPTFSQDKKVSPFPLNEDKKNILSESRRVPLASRSSFAAKRGASSISSNKGVRDAIPPPLPLERDAATLTSPAQSVGSPISSIGSIKSTRLKPLHLPALNSERLSRALLDSTSANYFRHSRHRMSNSSASVSSSIHSITNNRLLSSCRSSPIPVPDRGYGVLHFRNGSYLLNEPLSAPLPSLHGSPTRSQTPSGLSEPPYEHGRDEADITHTTKHDPYDDTIRQALPPTPLTVPISRALSISRAPSVLETPRPTLMFAIASDDVEQVKQVLESGEVNPNEAVGPQSALAFTLTNDKLANKLEIVKALLAHGADPESVKKIEAPAHESQTSEDPKAEDRQHVSEGLDHATRYYLDRADAVHTKRSSALIQRSFFRPLTRVRYELIGQDRALEQLFRVLSMRSRELTVAPIVVMLCGPSGHGKSLLARKFGSLLDVPTHTVNMTTLRSSHDLWQSYSMSLDEEPSTCTLAEFLVNNEGRRCVVVLDEIEKTANEKILWSLYMPWELGRYALETSGRHVDVRNVIWLGTSNIGHDLIFNHHEMRRNPDELMSREEYLEVMSLLRSKVSERLGASILSRVTTVLPFVPFTLAEKKAICAEALGRLAGDAIRQLESKTVESLINSAIAEYYPAEGVRSLHRSISNQLLDII